MNRNIFASLCASLGKLTFLCFTFPGPLSPPAQSLLPFPVDTPTLNAMCPYLRKLWWRETLSAAELAELRARVMDLEWVKQPSRALFDLSFLARWVETLNAVVPSVLVEEDRYLAAQIAKACDAIGRQPPAVAGATPQV
jgi:hypothetical protein